MMYTPYLSLMIDKLNGKTIAMLVNNHIVIAFPK